MMLCVAWSLVRTYRQLRVPDSLRCGSAGVVGQFLIQGIAEVPAVSQVQTCALNEPEIRADALEKHHQLQPQVDDRIDARSAPLCVKLVDPA